MAWDLWHVGPDIIKDFVQTAGIVEEYDMGVFQSKPFHYEQDKMECQYKWIHLEFFIQILSVSSMSASLRQKNRNHLIKDINKVP